MNRRLRKKSNFTEYSCQVCVLTTTYNIGSTLSQDFYWLIVDDGSADDTEVIVQSFLNASIIPIEYLKIEHAGRCLALNTALASLPAQSVTFLDADDELISSLRRWKRYLAIAAIPVAWAKAKRISKEIIKE